MFSVSLWLMNSEQKHTTESQRTQRLHREIPDLELFVQSEVNTCSFAEIGGLKWSAAGETRVDVVPPFQFIAFAKLPAQ